MVNIEQGEANVWDHVESINIKSSFTLKEKEAYQSHWITLYQLNEQLKCIKANILIVKCYLLWWDI